MLFGKRNRIVKRILIVEDEPLTAFDNEALELIEREQVDLILSDVRLRSHATGIDLALAAKGRGIPTLFASGHAMPAAAEVAVGCLKKPYSERQLKAAIDTVDRHLSGEAVKPPKGLELFVRVEN